MPVDTSPVDPNVAVPASVRRAAERANAVHKEAYPDGNPPAPAAAAPASEPAPAAPAPEPPAAAVAPAPEPLAPAPAPAPEPPAAAPAPQPDNWEHRYHAMRGRHDQALGTIGSMQQQMSELGDELMRTQQALALLQSGAQQPALRPGQPPNSSHKLVTDKDREVYGEELLDVVARVARDAVAPEIDQTQQQVRQVGQRVTQTATQNLYADLAREVPDWREVNVNPRFKVWCHQPDVYSGALRGALLNAAFKAANAPRVAAFFKGFLAEEQATGNAPQPQTATGEIPLRQPAVSMGTLVAPGRAKPAGGDQTPSADKPVYTHTQIAAFYNDVRRGAYAGRDNDKMLREKDIFAAQLEGRVRG